MSKEIETYGVLDTHYLTDLELAILLSATLKPIEKGAELLKGSLGFIVVVFEGKGYAPLLRCCEFGLQLPLHGECVVTHTKPPSTIRNQDQALDIIDSINISVDYETWLNKMVEYKVATSPQDAQAWFNVIESYVETQDRTDVVVGRKMRDPEAVDFPLENLV